MFSMLSKGGIGCYPGAMLGTSSDGPLAVLACNDEKFSEILYQAARLFTDIKKNLQDELADTISDAMMEKWKKGKLFMEKTLLQSRLLNSYESQQWLESRNVMDKNLLKLAYRNMPEYRLRLSSRSAPQYRKLVDRAKSRRGFKIDIRKKGKLEFPYIQNLIITKQKAATRLRRPHNFMALTGKYLRLCDFLGTKVDPGSKLMSPITILSQLRDDPDFRKDIEAESILDMIIRKGLARDIVGIENFLVFLGARRDVANHVAAQLLSNINTYNFSLNSVSFSLSDTILPNLELGDPYDNTLAEFDLTPNKTFNGYLYSLGALYSLLEFMRTGELYTCKIQGRGCSLTDALLKQKVYAPQEGNTSN